MSQRRFAHCFARTSAGHLRLEVAAALAAMALLGPHAASQVTTRVSLTFEGNQANRSSDDAAISADGRHVAFVSEATNLVLDDGNVKRDIFLHDLDTGVTERVSVSWLGLEANDFSEDPRLSADGRFVAFTSTATNLVPHDLNGARDVFVRDRLLGTTELISVSSTEVQANLGCVCTDFSPDGNLVVFSSAANNLVGSDFGGDSDVFVRDRALGVTERVSVSTAGSGGAGHNSSGTLSADGRFVAFRSEAFNLVPDSNFFADIFLRDRQAGTTALISVGNLGQQGEDQPCNSPDISADGRYVAFTTPGVLVGVGQPAGVDVYVRDVVAGTTEIANLDSDGALIAQDMANCAISADGRYVTLDTLIGIEPVQVRDRVAGATQVVAIGTLAERPDLGSQSVEQPFSADGRFVVFSSFASNIVADDTNNASDIFLRDTRPFFADLGQGLAGIDGVPSLTGSGVLLGGEAVAFTLAEARPSAPSWLIISPFALSAPFKGGTLVPAPTLLLAFTTSVAGAASLPVVWPAGLPSDLVLYFQWWIQDPAGPVGFAASNALSATTP